MGATAVEAYVSLGSNLGDRCGHLRAGLDALARLPDVEVVESSHLYETEPVGPPPQERYLNAAVRLRTTLQPRALLEALLAIERTRGRERAVHHGPRTLDIDLLLYGARNVDEPGLRVPHPRLHERAFVLEPLAEIAGAVVHPVLGERIDELARRVRDDEAVRPWSDADGASARPAPGGSR